jgi:hypothetical protein
VTRISEIMSAGVSAQAAKRIAGETTFFGLTGWTTTAGNGAVTITDKINLSVLASKWAGADTSGAFDNVQITA